MNDLLDFCRVKKIDEKGFGFLKSLYYPRDIFFHFSQIKKEDFLEKLMKMKRGDFFLFFISRELPDKKRKAVKIWYTIDEIPFEYLEQFTERIIVEFNSGSTNIYDLIFAFSELKRIQYLNETHINAVLSSKKVLSLPTTILSFLSEKEKKQLKTNLKLDEMKDLAEKPYWYEDMINS